MFKLLFRCNSNIIY